MKILNHIVQNKGCKVLDSKNSEPLKDPQHIIIHDTGTTILQPAVRYLTNPKNKESAHLIINRNGEITQLTPFNIRAKHSVYSHYNDYSIRIYLVNPGRLTLINNNYYATTGTKIPKEEVITLNDEGKGMFKLYSQIYSKEQILSLISIVERLKQDYSQIDNIICHSDHTDQDTSQDKIFPWETLKLILKSY